MFSNSHVAGTMVVNRGLIATGAGGDCPASGRISAFAVTAITLAIS